MKQSSLHCWLGYQSKGSRILLCWLHGCWKRRTGICSLGKVSHLDLDISKSIKKLILVGVYLFRIFVSLFLFATADGNYFPYTGNYSVWCHYLGITVRTGELNYHRSVTQNIAYNFVLIHVEEKKYYMFLYVLSHDSFDIPLQKNLYDCGVYVCLVRRTE